jgi:hypothetical protein
METEMITQKLTIAACIAALSATLLSSNANAMTCGELTGNQLLAAIERGQCIDLGSANITVEDEYIRTSRNGGGDRPSTGKSGGGYKY